MVNAFKMRKLWFRRRLWKKSKGICFYCGVQMVFEAKLKDNKMTIEHLIPKSEGGKMTLTNCVAACYKCNKTRSNKSIAEFVGIPKKVEKKYCVCESPIIKRVKNYYLCIVCCAEFKHEAG